MVKYAILPYTIAVVKQLVNKYPRILIPGFLWCLLAFFAMPCAVQAQDVSQEQMEEDILHYVNLHRDEIGRPPLKLSDVITKECVSHSKNMAAHKVAFGHDGFEERVATIKSKMKPYHAVGENVAYGQLTAEKVVKLWLKSPGHRKNIEGDYNLTGIGIAQAKDGTIFFTQIFILNDD